MLARMGWFKWPLVVTLAIVLLAGASYLTTGVDWDGGFMPGQFRVLVVDESGNPVPGATLRVTMPASEAGRTAPLVETRTGNDMKAGDDGMITCHSLGYKFGGFAWKLFWLIPMGRSGPPRFDFEFRKEGFERRVLTQNEFFFDLRETTSEEVTMRSVYGTTQQVNVCKLKVVLARKRGR